jgi:enamine deaminase RidA (YjgF/YER057c/UK114 family)
LPVCGRIIHSAIEFVPDKGESENGRDKECSAFHKIGGAAAFARLFAGRRNKPGADYIYIAGQVSLDRAGKLVGERDMRAQAEQAFQNLKAALEASGAKFENVVKLNYYFTDISQIPVVREVRDRFINTLNPPASTAVEVKRLVRPEWLIEIEAVAIVPE